MHANIAPVTCNITLLAARPRRPSFNYFNSNFGMGGSKAKDKGGAQRKRARISGAKSGAGDEGESQSIVDEAGNDAAAEMTMADENAGGDASGGGASGGGSGGASQHPPAGLLARRLDKSKSENVQLAARVAELEEQLASEKASQNSPRPAPAPKVLKLITLKFIIFRDK